MTRLVDAMYLCSLFALPPSILRYCGSKEAMSAMEICAAGGSCNEVKEQIKSFRTLWPYLQFIAKVLRCDPYDLKPTECYWLGHPSVYRFNSADFEILLGFMEDQGDTPTQYIEELRANPPKAIIPFHTFQVLLSAKHGGEINEATLGGINNCMVSWGRVKQINEQTNEAELLMAQLGLNNGKLTVEKRLISVVHNPITVPNLQRGNYVAVHWETIVAAISPIRANRLEKATNEVLRIQHLI